MEKTVMENPSAILLRRLNPYCVQALDAAAVLCRTRAQSEITVEHWLLKLLEMGEGDITVIARHYQWDMNTLWQTLLAALDRLPYNINHQRPRLSDRLWHLLQVAWEVASQDAGNEFIRSAHLLQALRGQPDWLHAHDAWPLLSLSVTQLQRLRPLLDRHSDECPEKQVTTRLTEAGSAVDLAETAADNPMPNPHVLSPALQSVLDKFTLDITARAAEGGIDPVFGRDNDIRQMIDILSRRRKNNPILVGEPGVGKTALVEGLALRIAEGDVPASLKTVSIRALDLGLLQAGAGVKGEFEQRLKNVIEAVRQSSTPILLFIDEAHTLIGAGNQAGGADAANLLKPALARGELRTIAATTWSEYKRYFEQDAALERRFQRINVDEPDDETACLMLRGLKARYARHHGVHILDSAVQAAVTLSRRYLAGRQLPDKAVDLLDTAGARARMSLDTVPAALTQLQTQLTALEMEQQAIREDMTLGQAHHADRLAQIAVLRNELGRQQQQRNEQYQQEKQLTQQLLAIRQDSRRQDELAALQQRLATLQQGQPLLSPDVDARTVATVIADWTGIPLSSVLKDEQTGLLHLEQHVGERVIGQETALWDIAQRLRAAKTGLTPEHGPLGVFLLVGPSGVGKTETARALADSLFGGERSLITLNLSEYQEPHTVSQLKGAPPGYVGYGQGGILTEAVRQRPYSVVLLDEVEKAHRDVLNLFYQVFDRGFMRDGEGREIDFRQTVILMTSNLGSDHLMALLAQQPDAPNAALHERLYPVLRDHFQPALLARFQTVIYRPLPAEALRRIVDVKLGQVTRRLHTHYGLSCQVESALRDTLVSACLLPDSGARNIDSLLNQQILPGLSQALLERLAHHDKPGGVILGADETGEITLTFTETEPTERAS